VVWYRLHLRISFVAVLQCQDEPATANVSNNSRPNSRPASLSFVKVSPGGERPDSDVAREVESEKTEEEIVIRVVRPPGTGLGISIAGGVGATPYRANDQVLL